MSQYIIIQNPDKSEIRIKVYIDIPQGCKVTISEEPEKVRSIKFCKEKYDTGYYNVITRAGFPVVDLSFDAMGYIVACVPAVRDCRGNDRYGYLHNGRRNPSTKDILDLRLVLK